MILTVMIVMVMIKTDLMFSEGVNEGTIDIVDDQTESHNNHILGHSWAVRVSKTQTPRRVKAIRWGIHCADMKIPKISVREEHLKIFQFFKISF